VTPTEVALVVVRIVAGIALVTGGVCLGLAVVLFLLGVGLWKDYEVIVDPAMSLLVVGFLAFVPFGLLVLLVGRPLARFAARPVERAPKEK